MRDLNRVVIAEDNIEVRNNLRKLIEGTSGYQVWATSLREEIMYVLDDSNAYWLILDLELEDGVSKDKIPLIRSTYGTDVFIVVLTGNHNLYSEKVILSLGADLMLRKPYDPMALLQQMNAMRDRILGVGRTLPLHSKLLIEGKLLDLDTGDYEDEDGNLISLSSAQKILIQYLASSRNENGDWAPVDRGDVIIKVYGGAHNKYSFEDSKLSGQRLRQLVKAVRRLFTGEDCDDDVDLDKAPNKRLRVINVSRGSNHTTKYSLDKDVKLIPGNLD